MKSLYVDTSKYITIGLLDSSFEWIDYQVLRDLKASAAIHFLINEMCSRNNIDLKEINNFFYCAGPGSYTGMRVGSGIAQIMKITNKKIFSFYHYEVPSIVGIKDGKWVSDAFKKELFVYTWNEKEYFSELVAKDKFEDSHYYSNFDQSDDLNTSDLIKKKSCILFDYIYKKEQLRNDFYYRTLESEFGKDK